MRFLNKNPFIALGFLTLLLVGLPAAVFLSQNQAQNRSNAAANSAGAGGTGNCTTVNASTGDDLVSDNCTIQSGFNGSVIGNNNIIQGGLGGPIGNIIGNENEIFGGVNGCIKGNNNIIHGGVNGGVDGTGNTIEGSQGSGPCPKPTITPSPPTITPSGLTRCNDNIDNDNNSFIDTKDATCHSDNNPDNSNSYVPIKNGERSNTCNDNRDNNSNNLIDRADPICHTDKNPNNLSSYDPMLPENGNTCSDQIDNNNNNLIDIQDPICHTDNNPDNPNSYDPQLPELGGKGTILSLTLFLHGIGSSGDNATTLNSLSNKTPLRPGRTARVTIFDINNQLISSTSGQINYASSSGNYTGRVETSNVLPQGSYNIKVVTDQHLVRLLPGIQTIKTEDVNALPAVSMVTGDIINDNKLNILDYNQILDCFSEKLPAPACPDQAKKTKVDINDDGPVNGTDYNLFIRELSVQNGD